MKIRLLIPGGGATMGPPVGPALGSKGVNGRDFCTQFNAMTQKQKGELLRVFVSVHPDKRFDIEIKGTPASILIKKMAKVTKGSAEPNRNKVGSITEEDLKKIASVKKEVLNAFSEAAAVNILKGTARSMGINVIK